MVRRLGTLNVRSTLEVGTLDPANWSSPVDVYTLDAISEGLVSYKPGTWEVVNTLAETFEPSSDGLSYKFTLKQGIPFHRDFGEVTAEDVKFSYRAHRRPHQAEGRRRLPGGLGGAQGGQGRVQVQRRDRHEGAVCAAA